MNNNLKFMKAPSVIFRLPIRSQLGRMVLFTLASMENTGTQPSQGLLAYITNSTNTTISSIMNALEKEGWVNIIHQKNKKQGETNLYQINWSKIEEYTNDKDYFISNETVEEPKTVTPPAEEKKTVTPKIELDPIVDGEIDEDDCRYGEIDTTNPMVSFLNEEDDTPSFKDRIKENQFNCDVKEAANEMVILVRLKTPKAKLDEVFDRYINNISMKYSQRLDYVGDRIRAKAREILKAA